MSFENEDVIGGLAPDGLTGVPEGAGLGVVGNGSEAAVGKVSEGVAGSVDEALSEGSFENPVQLAVIVESIDRTNLTGDVKAALKGIFSLPFVDAIHGLSRYPAFFREKLREDLGVAVDVLNWMLSLNVSTFDSRYILEFNGMLSRIIDAFGREGTKDKLNVLIQARIHHPGFLEIWNKFMCNEKQGAAVLGKYEGAIKGAMLGGLARQSEGQSA